MKTILDHDNWVEIPEGEFLTGLSDSQRDGIVARLLGQAGYPRRPAQDQQLLDAAAAKLRKYPRVWLEKEERAAFRLDGDDPSRMLITEEALTAVPPQQSIVLKRFYVARYPVTELQYSMATDGTPPAELPGALDEPEVKQIRPQGEEREMSGRWAAAVQIEEALNLCAQMHARLPTSLEWEKAARGTDGRLYPWGNEWDPAAGFFSYDQKFSGSGVDPGRAVSGYPRGISPYGVWGMAGTLPELVTVSSPRPVMTRTVESSKGKLLVDVKGCHAKESSEAWAWFDHIVALPGRGLWVSLRPVLDEWPKTQWTGFRAKEER